MYKYYVNKNPQPTGEHEVHTSLCAYKPLPENSIFLGEYPSCHGAIVKAKEYIDEVDGCYFCSRECHTR
jgi:hypothetical protein